VIYVVNFKWLKKIIRIGKILLA